MRAENTLMKNLKIIDLSLFFEKEKILILGDLQLGIEDSLAKEGILLPKFNLKKIKTRLENIFKETKELNEIIINGDLKHEFTVSKQEWLEVFDLIEFLLKHTKKITIVKGNHDINLKPLLKFHDLKVYENYFIEKLKAFILHGDKIPDFKGNEFKKAKLLIIGHEHPAISLKHGIKKEKFKCFLKGKFKGKTLIVMPSFTDASIGNDILNEQILSPFLQENLSDFEVWLIEDKPYYFGLLKNLEPLK